MHIGCLEDMCKSNMSEESKIRCVMCRTKYPKNDKENVEYVRNWAMKNKAWAQTILAKNIVCLMYLIQNHSIFQIQVIYILTLIVIL